MNLLLIALAAALPALPQARTQEPPVRSDQEILIQLERDWDKAFLRADAAFIAPILAEEFLATYDDGSRGDRALELKLASEFNKQIDSSSLDEFVVKIYRDTAVVWFTRHLAGPSRGKHLELTHHYTDVFVFRDGRWQCVSSQSTLVQMENK
jgi:ketosteroid isomerase-like protein